MSSRTCQHCGCSEIDVDTARGDAVCTNCGSVLEDNIIVSEVQFEESGHGGSRAIGQLVSAEGQSSGGLNLGFQHGMGKESRMITLQNARRKITQVAEQLRLNQHCIDTAYNFYKMALIRRLTRGRRSSHVIAACIYMVCRIEGTPHMLLDLSDVVQVNVYELGRCYLALSTALCLNIPALDPALYIVRFAHRLELGDNTHEVSMTALRLVQRMKRDWIHTGRRPSGLCGAALLFASRLHNFNRTVKDIVKVVKVCENTVRKRLNEFGETPSAQLTLNEFMAIDLEEEQDPPCFKAARKKLKQPQVTDGMSEECEGLKKEIEDALLERRKKHKEPSSTNSIEQSEESLITEQFLLEDTIEAIDEFINLENGKPASSGKPESSAEMLKKVLLPGEDGDHLGQGDSLDGIEAEATAATKQRWLGLAPTAASLGLKATIEECMQVNHNSETVEESGELDLTGLEDSELDSYILTEEEASAKTNMWNEVHAEYLEELRQKEEQKAKEEEENLKKPEQKKKKRTMQKKKLTQASTAGEAIEKMLQEKKISSKINYDVLKSLNSTPLKGSESLVSVESSPKTPTSVNNSGFSFFSKRSPAKALTSPVMANSRSNRKAAGLGASGGTPPSAISGLISSIISNQSKKRKVDEDIEDKEGILGRNKKAPIIGELQDDEVNEENDKPLEGAQDQDLVEDEDEEEEEIDDNYLSAAQLLGQHRGEENLDDDHYDYDEYS